MAAGPRVEERRVVTVLFCDLAGFTARKAHILACRGAVADSVALKDRFLPRGRDIGDPQVTSNILPMAAFIEQSGGSLDAALALVEELERATGDGRRARAIFDHLGATTLVAETDRSSPSRPSDLGLSPEREPRIPPAGDPGDPSASYGRCHRTKEGPSD